MLNDECRMPNGAGLGSAHGHCAFCSQHLALQA
jgi:hypothetical protein